MRKVLFSVGGSSGMGWQDFLEVCQTCDELGFHGFYPSDHLMQVQQGKGTTPNRMDALTAMAAVSGHTKRLRLGVLVVNNLFRHPVIVAKMFNTIDHASGGRAELGMGGGWSEIEHTTHGMEWPPFRERIERLDEALSLIRALWTEEPASFKGKYYCIDEAPMMPKPMQKPYPPIIVGGTSDRTMRVAAKHADDWNQIEPLESARRNIERMKAVCAESGRDFSQLRLSVQVPFKVSDSKAEIDAHVARAAANFNYGAHAKSEHYATLEDHVRASQLLGSVEDIKEQVARWVDIGVNHFILTTPRPFDRASLEKIAGDVAPTFAG